MEISFKDEKIQQTEIELTQVSQNKCEICFKNKAQYTCPKCNVGYCSLNCYQDQVKHLSCSESFYQTQVINELKSCKINDEYEYKNKIANILKREKENMENEEHVYDEYHDENSIQLDIEKVNDQELLKTYKNEVIKWTPWWLDESLKKKLVDEINDSSFNSDEYSQFNLKLVQNALELNVSNASNLIYNEILKLSYLYFIVGYVYQLKLDTDIETDLIEEITFSLIQVQKLIDSPSQKSNIQSLDLTSRLNLVIKILSTTNDKDFFLKNNINKTFLINLLNDLIFVANSPNIILYLISHLYDLFETSISKSFKYLTKKINEPSQNEIKSFTTETNEEINENPINFFHFNNPQNIKIPVTQIKTDKKSKVDIIKKTPNIPKPSTKNTIESEATDFSFNKKEARAFLKKLEFYFKWLCLNQGKLILNASITTGELKSLKDQLTSECGEFDENKEYFDKNLNFIRKKFQLNREKLIEEI